MNTNVVPKGETVKNPAVAAQADRMEDQEQRRRVQLDKAGEQHRQMVAQEVASMVDTKTSASSTPAKRGVPADALAPIAGSGYVESALNTGLNALHSAFSTGKNIVSQVTHVAEDAAGKLSNAAGGVVSNVTPVVQNISQKTAEAATAVSQKTSQVAQGAMQKIHEVADNITYKTTLAYVHAEEEAERLRRMESETEECSIHNALNLSQLVRGRGLLQQPNMKYAARLLEETGRRWRMKTENSALASANAKQVVGIVVPNIRKFNPQSELYLQSLQSREQARTEGLRKLAAEAVLQEKQLQQTLRSGNKEVESLEEQERSRRLTDTRQQQLARQNAKVVSGMVSESSGLSTGTGMGTSVGSIGTGKGENLDVSIQEEAERLRRMVDRTEQQQHKNNAKVVSDIVKDEGLSSSGGVRSYSAAM